MFALSKVQLLLQSIMDASNKILTYSTDFSTADDFYHDELHFDATMMQFVIIGEMVDKLDGEFKTDHQNIPWSDIKDFRNIVAHNYFGIDAEEVWDIIQNHIPGLMKTVSKVMTELN